MNKILTLWDIDGNLVNVYKYHTPAYQKAIEEVYGTKIPFSEIENNYGLPAKEVVAIPLRKKGIAEEMIQERIEQVFSIYSKQLEEGIKKVLGEQEILLPGVSTLLKKLKSMKIPMGVVTGNIKKAGESIIRGSRIDYYFNPILNSFGDGVTDRYEIISNAINSAKKNKIIVDYAKIYVFGDTSTDIEAAKKNDCISIGVIKNSNNEDSSPGGISYIQRKELLTKSNPHYLFDDYTNVDKVLSILKV